MLRPWRCRNHAGAVRGARRAETEKVAAVYAAASAVCDLAQMPTLKLVTLWLLRALDAADQAVNQSASTGALTGAVLFETRPNCMYLAVLCT